MTTTSTTVAGVGSVADPSPAALPPRGRFSIGSAVERYGLLLVLAAIVVFFSVAPASGVAFSSQANWVALTANQAVTLVVALALLFPMAAGFFDFSVGAMAATSSVITAAAMSAHDLPLAAAVGLALIAGVLVGGLQGLLVAYLGMNPFIATLGTATLLGGGIFAYTGGLQITQGISPSLTAIGSNKVLGLPTIVLIAVAVALLCWFGMSQTAFGRRVFAVGSNAQAARLVGVDVRRVQLLAFVVSGLVAAAAGVLLLARQGAATSDNGMSMLFPALTAVLLSTIVIDVGRPSVLGTIIGVLFVAVSISGLTLIGSPAWVSSVFTGAALLLAVGVASLGRLRRR